MYIVYNTRDDKNGIPRDIDGQADFWCDYYRPEGDRQDYITAANALEKGRLWRMLLFNFGYDITGVEKLGLCG